MCLLDEVVRASEIVTRAAEKIRRLERVAEAARRHRAGKPRSVEDLDASLASLERPESPPSDENA
jgi:hypothetical protein